MEEKILKDIEPKCLDDFTGNKKVITQLKNWLNNLNKRICYLTGSVGTGKSTLAKVLLKEFGYSISYFEGNDLRIKKNREILIQTLKFKNIIAMLEHNKDFKRAVIIEEFENIGLITQELYRNIREVYKKKYIKVPIIFTGTKYFKGKKPLSGHSVFFRLSQRNQHEIRKIVEEITEKCNINISKKYKEQLIQNSAGDIRRIVHNISLNVEGDSINHKLVMAKNYVVGPLNSLYRILNTNISRTIDECVSDLTIDGTIPFGIHWTYLEYFKDDDNIKNMASLLADYGILLDKERLTQFWFLREIANTMLCLGTRVESGNNKNIGKNNKNWWTLLEKEKINGDAPVETPCMNKTLRGSLITYQLQNSNFEMLGNGIGNCHCWKPSTNRRTIELLKLRETKIDKKNKLIKLITIE